MRAIPLTNPEGFKDSLEAAGQLEELWLIFHGQDLFVGADQKTLPSEKILPLDRIVYLGEFRFRHIYVGEVKKKPKTPKRWDWVGLRELTNTLDRDILALAGRGMQLLDWDRNHAFCGVCGAETQLLEIERCRKCSACGHLSYPKIAPVVMALVRRGEKLLLARGAHFPPKTYSVLAGYVDPGESLEQAVAREVKEEVGVVIQNPVYFASQPWPFSGSLIIAFLCDWKEGEIEIDPKEIEDAAWFSKDQLPQLPPEISLARFLINSQL